MLIGMLQRALCMVGRGTFSEMLERCLMYKVKMKRMFKERCEKKVCEQVGHRSKR